MTRTPKKRPLDADKSGTVPAETPAEAVPQAVRGTKDIKLLQHPYPEVVDSGFGPAYLAGRSRPIPADSVQVIIDKWGFRAQGYAELNSPTPTMPNYTDPETLLQDWYTYMRDIGKFTLKYKHTPTTLSDTDNFRDYIHAGQFVIANLVMLFNLTSLVMYNQAMAALCVYLPKKRARLSRLWDRVSAIPYPAIFKNHAIMSGLISHRPGVYPPYIRIWHETALLGNLYGISGNYTDQSAIEPNAFFTNETNLDNFIDNIEKAVQVVEGRVAAALTPDDEDIIAIRDVIDMLRDIPGYDDVFTTGLPDPKGFPGLVVSDWHRTELYARGLAIADTHGVSADEYNMFPVIEDDAFDDKVPVARYGPRRPAYDFTLLGAAKAFQLNDSTTGLRYTAQTNPVARYGTDSRMVYNGDYTDIYTREDGFVNLTMEADYGDGAGIRGAWNTGHPFIDHIYMKGVAFAGQLAANREDRWIDNLGVDEVIWVDTDDFAENYAFLLQNTLKVPYLK